MSKNPIPINIVCEDILHRELIFKLLSRSGRYERGRVYMRGGSGYIRSKIGNFNIAARRMPYFVLTDLDLKECPPALISEWLSEPRHPNLIFRIAVREVESWIMADHQHFSKFFGVSMKQLPENCDTIRDPKVFLKDLILRSRKKSFRKMLPESGSTAKIGNEYNSILSIFITDIWDHEQAREHSDSLNRAIISLEKFTPSWQEI